VAGRAITVPPPCRRGRAAHRCPTYALAATERAADEWGAVPSARRTSSIRMRMFFCALRARRHMKYAVHSASARPKSWRVPPIISSPLDRVDLALQRPRSLRAGLCDQRGRHHQCLPRYHGVSSEAPGPRGRSPPNSGAPHRDIRALAAGGKSPTNAWPTSLPARVSEVGHNSPRRVAQRHQTAVAAVQ